MVRLDKSLFHISLQLVALRIPKAKTALFVKHLAQLTLDKTHRLKPVQKCATSADFRLLLLAPDRADKTDLSQLPDELRDFCVQNGATTQPHCVELGYEHFSAEQVLKKLLPSHVEAPTSFEQVGHVAHLNLRDEHLPYKQLIGEVFLDKNAPRIRTVVNKLETLGSSDTAREVAAAAAAAAASAVAAAASAAAPVDASPPTSEAVRRDVYRVFPMEVLAGEPSLRTTMRENGAIFHLDFGEVYWNSRLEREHRRVVELIGDGAIVCDMFAGIGPFAVPAAKRGCRVYANDLNPASAEWLRTNVAANKVGPSVTVSSLDARQFVRELLGTHAAKLEHGPFGHVVMNLPASAIEFLDVFVGAFRREAWPAALPRVHCYCFSKEVDATADAIARVEQVLGASVPGAEAHVVRDVAPRKLMVCVSFTLPDEVAWADDAPKRRRVDDGRGV